MVQADLWNEKQTPNSATHAQGARAKALESTQKTRLSGFQVTPESAEVTILQIQAGFLPRVVTSCPLAHLVPGLQFLHVLPSLGPRISSFCLLPLGQEVRPQLRCAGEVWMLRGHIS